MADITLRDVAKTYPNGFAAVRGIDLDIADGEFLVLVGPSGCGKSTLLRMIAGIEDVTDGAIFIGDRDVTAMPPQKRDIVMVFQDYALYPHMTVRDNLAYGLKLKKMPKAEWRRRVDEVAKTLGLEDLLDRKPAKLSGGQRQRVAMGRAIVREPQVFCMDEPLSNLDAKLRVQTRTQIAALQRRLGTTTVYVTHDQVEAMTMGDRVAVLKKGVLQQFASPSDLYDQPANAFVAGFIGSPAMNMVTAPIVADGVKLGESVLELERDQLIMLHDAKLESVTVGVRPEALEVSTSGGVEAIVDLVEDLGSESYIYTHAKPGIQLVARCLDRVPAKLADTVRLRRRQGGAVHLFDPDTGERVGE